MISSRLSQQTAPDFSLVDQNGKTFTRSKNKKPLVVYFYPADSTPGCTVQANAFNDEIQVRMSMIETFTTYAKYLTSTL